jgi:hypothetical protein
MGEAADRIVNDIARTRAQIDRDLAELESRLPRPLRNAKAIAGATVGGSTVAGVTGWFVKRSRAKSKRSEERRGELVVRVVTEPSRNGDA